MGLSISLDVQTGHVCDTSGRTQILTEDQLGVLYWCALDAPAPYVARQLGLSTDTLSQTRQQLARSLGIGDKDLIGIDVQLSNGAWPRSAVPWMHRTAARLIQNGLDRSADDVLLYVAGEGALTVGDVRGLINQIRAGLHAEGIRKGSRVALDATQRVESFLIASAILLEGAEIVRLGDNLGPETLLGMINAAPSQVTFTADANALHGHPAAGKIIALEPSTADPAFADWIEAFADHAGTARPPADVLPNDVAFIGFTSGSSGVPKIVQNTHQAIWRSTEVAARQFGFTAKDVFMTATDFVALSGFRSMLSLPYYTGGKVVFPSAAARATPLAQALECEEYGVTCLTAVPNVLRGFVAASDRLTAGAHPTLRMVLSGSGVLDASCAQAFHDRFGATVVDYYGKREMGTALYSVPEGCTTMNTHGGRASEVLLRILDDTSQPVKDRTPGEIVVLTDSGQLLSDAASKGSGGWHKTGDFGMVVDGNVIITGRKSDIIKTPDGQLLAPIEVENTLAAHPAVSEAVVFACVGADAVERVGAAVLCMPTVLDGTIADLEKTLQWTVRDAIGAYKTPQNILVLQQFPRAGRGKPDRIRLRHEFDAMFGPAAHKTVAVAE